jgi:hypothetical protein
MALNRGQPAEARNLAELAVHRAKQSGSIYVEAMAHRVWALALVALGTAEWDEVSFQLSASLDGLKSGQALLELARTQAVFGNLCCIHGRDAEARVRLQAASEQFSRSGLHVELAAVQAAIRSLET